MYSFITYTGGGLYSFKGLFYLKRPGVSWFRMASALVLLAAAPAYAQTPFSGQYTGLFTIEYSGVVSVAETGVGPAFVTIDESGAVTTGGELSGSVDDTGLVTWSTPNPFYFTTGQITEGDLTSEGSREADGLTTIYRLRASNAAGGFGGTVAANLEPVSPLPNRDEVVDVIHDGTQFVALTAGRSVLVSADAVTWEEYPIPATDDLNAIAYGNGVYVVAGDAGNAFRSSDLEVWTPISHYASSYLNLEDVAFGNGVFAMVNLTGSVTTSTDGLAWTTSGSVGGIGQSIDFVNGRFIAGGLPYSQGYYQTITSTDGTTWSSPATTTLRPSGHDAAYGNGIFVLALGSSVLTSADGLSWTAHSIGRTVNGIVFDGAVFVGVGSGSIATSTDGVSWTQIASADTNNRVAFDGTIYVAVGRKMASAASVGEWSVLTRDLAAGFDRTVDTLTLGASGNGYVLVRGTGYGGGGDDGAILRSTDGVDWEAFDEPDSPNAMVFGNGIFSGIRSLYNSAAGTTKTYLMTSPDGTSWEAQSELRAGMNQLFFANGQFISFTTGYTTTYTMTSADGVNWDLYGRPYDSVVYGFTHMVGVEGAYVALSSSGRIYRSTDLEQWDQVAYVAVSATGLASGNGRLVAVGSNSGTGGDARILMSEDDGLTWTNTTPATDNEVITCVAFAGGRFIAVAVPFGSGIQTLLSSPEGETWLEEDLNIDRTLYDILAFGQGFLIADEGSGKILLRGGLSESLNPQITSLSSPQTVAEGDPLALNATVSGVAPFSYRWLRDGVPVVNGTNVSGADGPALTIAHAGQTDAGRYQLSVTDANGAVLSSSVDVRVISLPDSADLAAELTSQVVPAGSDLVLSLPVDPQTQSVTWFRGSAQIGVGAEITISAVDAGDAGQYYAVVSNLAGETVLPEFSVSVVGNPGGLAVDRSFSIDGSVFDTVPWITGSIELPTGQIVVWGWFDVTFPSGGTVSNIAMFASDGSIVDTFAPAFNSGVSGVVYDNVSGTLVVGGPFTTTNGQDIPAIAHLDLDGTIVSTPPRAAQIYNGKTYAADINAVSKDAQGRIYVNGYFTHVDGEPREHIIRLTVDTSATPRLVLDETFTTAGLLNTAYPVRFQSTGLMVGRYLYTNSLYRFLENGTTDGTFTSSDTSVQSHGTDALAVDSSDRIYHGGGVGGSYSYPRLVRLGADGVVDASFSVVFDSSGVDRFKKVEGLLVLDNGTILVGGSFTSINGNAYPYLSVVDQTGASVHEVLDMGTGLDGNVVSIRRGQGSSILVVGGFQHVDGEDRPYLLRLSASTVDLPLALVSDPVDVGVHAGETAALSLAVTGNLPLSVEWYRNDVLYTTTTSPILVIDDVTEADAGDFYAVVTDASENSVTSGVATLTVSPAGPPAGTLDVETTTAGVQLSDGTAEIELLDDKTWVWDGGNSFQRLNSNGSVDAAYDSGVVFEAIHDVAVDDDGMIYVAGRGTNVSGGAADRWSLVRLDRNGVQDATFDTGTGFGNGSANVHTVAVFPDGRVAAGGRFSSFNGISVYNHVILLPDGSMDPVFAGAGVSGGGAGDILDIAFAGDGSLLLAGNFGVFPGSLNNALVNLDPYGNVVPTFNFPFGTNSGFYNDGQTVSVTRVEETLGAVIAVGDFSAFGGEPANNIVAIRLVDGKRDDRFDFGSGFNAPVTQLEVSFTGDVFAGGTFTQYNGVAVPNAVAIHGLPIHLLITDQPEGTNADLGSSVLLKVEVFSASTASFQWQKDGADVPGAVSDSLAIPVVAEADEGVYRVLVRNDTDRLLSFPAPVRVLSLPEIDRQPVGGTFLPGERVVVSASVAGAGTLQFQWFKDGTLLPETTGAVLEIPVVGPEDAGTYHLTVQNAYGSVTTEDAVLVVESVPYGVPDDSFDPGTGLDYGEVRAFLPLPDGSLLIGGSFSRYNGVVVHSVIKIDGGGKLDTDFNLNTGFGGGDTVYAMGLQSDGGVILGGEFTSYNGTSVANLIRIDQDGVLDTDFAPGDSFTFDGRIADLLMLGDEIVVVGQFSGGIARFGADGVWKSGFAVGGGVDGHIEDIDRLADGRLVIGGYFFEYSGDSSANAIAYLDPVDGSLDDVESTGVLSNVIHSVAPLPDGGVIAAYNYRSLVYFDADAELDLSYPGINANLGNGTEIVLLPNGTLVVGGNIGGGGLAAYKVDGTPLAGLPALDNTVYTLLVDPAGRLLVGGDFVDTVTTGHTGVTRLLVGGMPVHISRMSADTHVAYGGSTELAVQAGGTAPLSYQWFYGESGDESQPITGAIRETFTTGAVTEPSTFWVRVSDSFGVVNSETVTIGPIVAPEILAQPTDLHAVWGKTLTFAVQVLGGGNLVTRWIHDGTDIDGETGLTLVLDPVEAADAGTYTVEVSNEIGSMLSGSWILSVDFPVVVRARGPGSVTPSSGVFENGQMITVSAETTSSFYEFVVWHGDVPPADADKASFSLAVTQPTALEAEFGLRIPAEWLVDHGVSDPDSDGDEDGWTARQEYELGTDPNDDGTNVAQTLLSVEKGWNLLSLPLVPFPETTLDDIIGEATVGPVWRWDTYTDLFEETSIPVSKWGYWAYAPAAASGIPLAGQVVVDPRIVLLPGWNLIGPAWDSVLADPNDVTGTIWSWDVSTQRYVPVKGGLLLSRHGYWIRSDEEKPIDLIFLDE